MTTCDDCRYPLHSHQPQTSTRIACGHMKSEFGAEKTKEAKSALPSVFRRLSHEYTSRSDVAQPQALGQSRVRALNRLTIVNISAIRTDSNSTHSRVVTTLLSPIVRENCLAYTHIFPFVGNCSIFNSNQAWWWCDRNLCRRSILLICCYHHACVQVLWPFFC